MSIPRSHMSDGRSPRVPYRTEEIGQDLAVHRKTVAGVLGMLATRLRQRAGTHDRTVSDMFKAYADGVNKTHAEGGTPWAFTPEEHMRSEPHHWGTAMPAEPDIVDLLEYMVDRTVLALQHEGLAPVPLELAPALVKRILAKTEEELSDMAGSQEVQDA